MLPFVKKGIAERKAGKPQGTIANFSPDRANETIVELIEFDAGEYHEREITDINELYAIRQNNLVSWLCFYGLKDVETLKTAAEMFSINPLTIEDILNPDHRPKFETFDNYLFVIIKMIDITDDGKLKSEQVSFVIGENYVLTFQEDPGDVFDPIRERLRKNIGKLRQGHSDYLSLSLIDIIIDNYFVVLECLAEALEELEVTLLKTPDEFNGNDVHELKMQLSTCAKFRGRCVRLPPRFCELTHQSSGRKAAFIFAISTTMRCTFSKLQTPCAKFLSAFTIFTSRTSACA